MALSEWVGTSLDAPVAAIRRHAISLSVVVAAVIGAIYYTASAATIALEASFGPVSARLLIAAALLAIAIAAFYAPRLFRAAAAEETTPPEPNAMTRDQKIAMVIEALLLGFSVGSRKPAGHTDRQK